ncbi:hypothetical protein KKH3_27260 [Pectobacterium actinidiae]|nr:hypothetical protein KKH3_27260 [Pectobacterium actinidiae]
MRCAAQIYNVQVDKRGRGMNETCRSGRKTKAAYEKAASEIVYITIRTG